MCLRKNRKPSRMLLGDISSSLFANLRNSMNINVYFNPRFNILQYCVLFVGKYACKRKSLGV